MATYDLSALRVVENESVPAPTPRKRAAKGSPLLDVVGHANGNRDKSVTINLVADPDVASSYSTDRKENKVLGAILRDLNSAGRALNVSVHKRVDYADGVVQVTFWVTDKRPYNLGKRAVKSDGE